ncbi:MAG: ATP-binding domain-containing protein [Actinomycetota bacterium]|nr:ATP-binding domain-containing protein [Actinomycetota bacterium]
MSDQPGFGFGAADDRAAGLEPVDGFAFESDGSPIGELHIEDPDSLVDRGASVAQLAIGQRSWRFGHVIVDEAQDLTPMQWRMIARRARSLSMTVVGDLAQCSTGEPGSWRDHLPATVKDFAYRELTVNYRSPAEINDVASSVLADLAPDLEPSRAIRSTGHAPEVRKVADLGVGLADALTQIARSHEGSARRVAVIAVDPSDFDLVAAGLPGEAKVQWLTPWQSKGLEFDHVVLVEPAAFLARPRGLSLLYVALTRSTDRLTVLHCGPLPQVLATGLNSNHSSNTEGHSA